MNQNTVVTVIDQHTRVTEMPLNPATIKRRLATVWNIPHQLLINIDVRAAATDAMIRVTIPVESWKKCGASRVTGTTFMGDRVAYVVLKHSDLIRQEAEFDEYEEFLSQF